MTTAAPTTTAPPTTTAAPTATSPVSKPAEWHVAAQPAPAPPRPLEAAPATSASGYGCGPALSYLAAYAAPGFAFRCPGYALGHQAMTCVDVSGVCPGQKLIVIADPCSAAYKNEASNSWVLTGRRSASIDPYGACP